MPGAADGFGGRRKTRAAGLGAAATLGWLCASCGWPKVHGEPVPAAPIARRLVLDDFEGPEEAGGRRYAALVNGHPRPASDEVRIARVKEAGGHCLEIHYDFRSPDTEELGVRIDLGGIDASGYDRLAFRVKGLEAVGYDRSFKAGFRRPKPGAERFAEDGTEVIGGVGPEWTEVEVPLNRLAGISDWSRLDAFFVAIERRRSERGRGTWCLDDVELRGEAQNRPTIRDPAVPRRKRQWEAALGGRPAARARVQQRLNGWPERLRADVSSLPRDDRAFLGRLARDTWRGLDALTDRENGLPLDHLRLGRSLAVEEADLGDYTSPTNVGLYLICVAAAAELGILDAAGARARVARLLDTLDRLERYEGFFFNYYDTVTLERTSHFVSFVDSAWLTAGLVVARSAFPELAARIAPFVDGTDYSFFYDEVAGRMSHGYYVNVPVRSPYHYGLLYTEARLGSLIAIGKGDVPEEHWFSLQRTPRPDDDWQTQVPRGRRRKAVRGHVVTGGWYEWEGVRFVPSWGGSLFEALMPLLVVDERRWAPRSLGRNAEAHVEIQRRFAAERLGWPVWGISSGASPTGEGYGEWGVPVLGAAGYPPGAVTPYAAALALAVDPEAAIADLRRLATRYESYGDYGFYDAVDPRSGRVARSYLALDQAMVLIAVANHLTDGAIRRRFEADPIGERAVRILGEEEFFD